MSTFELELDHFDGDRLDVDVEPSEQELCELFEAFSEDFQLADPEGFVIDLMAFLDGETVVLTGKVGGTFDYMCGRCLTDRQLDVSASLDFKLVPREEWDEMYRGEEEVALESDELDVDFYEGHSIDLRPFIRDAITLELPQWPQCPEEFRQECDAAYEEHVGDETLDKLEEHSVDLRWWPLKDIDLEESDEQDETGGDEQD